jgi:uncharacterized protein YecE (DUF72 family)
MPRVHVGQASLKGHLERYAKTFDLLEVRSDPALPSLKHLKRLSQQAPEGFSFSLVLPRKLSELSETPDAGKLAEVRTAAAALGARFVLVRTPATFAPSARSRARFAALVKGLEGAGTIAWEPRGIWTDEEIASVAAELGVLAVRDLAEQDPIPGPLVYTRLLALGRNTRIGSGAIERVSERLEEVEEAFIVVEGQGAVQLAKRLRGGESPEDSEDEDDEDEDEDESDDDESGDGEDGEDEDGDDEDGDDEDGDDEDGDDDLDPDEEK